MRKRLYGVICIICTLTFIAACTVNGDDTPVEAKGEMEKTKTSNSSTKINTLLKEV